jgi:hypothetical protein
VEEGAADVEGLGGGGPDLERTGSDRAGLFSRAGLRSTIRQATNQSEPPATAAKMLQCMRGTQSCGASSDS